MILLYAGDAEKKVKYYNYMSFYKYEDGESDIFDGVRRAAEEHDCRIDELITLPRISSLTGLTAPRKEKLLTASTTDERFEIAYRIFLRDML